MVKSTIKASLLVFLLQASSSCQAWTQPESASSVSRRQAFAAAFGKASVAATALVSVVSTTQVQPSWAVVDEETPRIVTRMGGLLEPFQDGPRGIRIMAPYGWNKFEGEVGAYDVKWQDLVDPTENIKISSTPVKSTTESVAVLGEVQQVGESLAAKRNGKLISATERLTDGVLFYKFEFALSDNTRQLLQLCVCKGKLWSIDAGAKEKRWGQRKELYENVFGSFMPKLA